METVWVTKEDLLEIRKNYPYAESGYDPKTYTHWIVVGRVKFTSKHLWTTETAHDPVHHPKHYTNHPSGIECIQVTEHMNFNIGNAVKYLWRVDEKGSSEENLDKAIWYIEREKVRRGLGPKS